MIKILFIENNKDILAYKSKMWELICLCDKDFFPALSTRENSLDGPKKYFEGLFIKEAKFLLAFSEEKLIGFSIFFHNYFDKLITKFTPCNYIKIACVHPDYRGLRIASTFNNFIEEKLPSYLVLPYIVRRTWSTNVPQLRLLENNGYSLIHKSDNDRGNNVSTVYFAKLINSKPDVA